MYCLMVAVIASMIRCRLRHDGGDRPRSIDGPIFPKIVLWDDIFGARFGTRWTAGAISE
jgi:hypothetical protein